jgi:hypothetical protein
MAQTAAASIPVERVALGALFVGFLKVSLLGFGGGMVWARRIVVDQKRWMDDREFADTWTLCQFMPGPNIVGITVRVGSRLRGSIGAITAVAGYHPVALDGRVVARWPILPLRPYPGAAEHPRGLPAAAADLMLRPASDF